MHRVALPICLALTLAGCASDTAPPAPEAGPSRASPTTTSRPAGEPVAIAKVGEVRVPLDRDVYRQFLEETRGLDAALNLMQRELAREQARQAGVTVGPDEVAAERERTLQQAFGNQVEPEAYDQALERLLAQQGLSEAEFDLTLETNALLRASARPSFEAGLTDEALRSEFGRRYGERARVRAISLPTLRAAADARQRAADGEDFAALARELNEDPTLAESGGEVEPFTRNSSLPEPVKAAAFALQPGEVSDPVQSEGQFLLLQLEEILPPVAVKYEDVRDALKEQVGEEFAEQIVLQSRQQYARLLATPGVLTFDAPALEEQYDRRLEALRPQPTSPEALKEQMETERPGTRPATRP